MTPESWWILGLQLLGIGCIATALVVYFLRNLMCRAHTDPGGKTILVTGCDTGVGFCVAKYFDKLGMRVFAGCLSPDSTGAMRLQVECSPRLTLLALDVTKEEQITSARDYIAKHIPTGENGLWAVINNAGVCVCGELDWNTPHQVQRQVDINLLGTIRVSKAFIRLLKPAKGRFINIGSVAGLYGYPGLAVYSGTKHGIEGFSSGLRHELNKFGIHVVVMEIGDFTEATELMSDHHRNMNEMWDQMDDVTRKDYEQHFKTYHNNAAKYGPDVFRRRVHTELPPKFLKSMEDAMLSSQPLTRYLILPRLVNRLKFSILSQLPRDIADYIIGTDYRNRMSKVCDV